MWYIQDELARDNEVLHPQHRVCFINPASMHREFCVLPREISYVPWDLACERNWLDIEQSMLIS